LLQKLQSSDKAVENSQCITTNHSGCYFKRIYQEVNAMSELNLQEVDKLEVTVLVDNYSDVLML
jgi:hypothetical protein